MITFPRCYAGLDLELPPDRTPANNGEHEPALPDKAVFASTDWVGALATRWERRLAESSGTTRGALDCGRILQLRECCDELRAEMESAPTGEVSDTATTGGIEAK